jgi:MFS family permease
MLVDERHLTPGLAGVMMSVGALGWALGSAIQGRDAFLHAKSALVAVGSGFLATGTAGFALVAALDLHHWLIGLAASLAGLGMGLAASSTSVLSLALSDRTEHGQAASALNLSDVLGSVIGISTTGAVFAALHDPAGDDLPVFVVMWLTMSLVACLGVVAGRRTRPDSDRRSPT